MTPKDCNNPDCIRAEVIATQQQRRRFDISARRRTLTDALHQSAEIHNVQNLINDSKDLYGMIQEVEDQVPGFMAFVLSRYIERNGHHLPGEQEELIKLRDRFRLDETDRDQFRDSRRRMRWGLLLTATTIAAFAGTGLAGNHGPEQLAPALSAILTAVGFSATGLNLHVWWLPTLRPFFHTWLCGRRG